MKYASHYTMLYTQYTIGISQHLQYILRFYFLTNLI